MKIIADDKIPFLKGVLDDYCDIQYLPGGKIGAADVKDADALIIRTRTKCNSELLEGSSVRFIATATIGFDHIDTDYCDKAGITWTNAPGCNSESVAQYMSAALIHLNHSRSLKLHKQTIGIIGVGHVGSKVSTLAKSLGMKVMLNDPPRARREGSGTFTGLDEILEKATMISFHVPLNTDGEDKTYHLVDEGFISQIKQKAILFNTSRGEVIKTSALKKALLSGALEGVVLDVWENEPLIDSELMQMAMLATPHIAGYSLDGKAMGTSMVVRAVAKYFGTGPDDWFPENIQEPANKEILIDCTGMRMSAVLQEVIMHSYDILKDDNMLRNRLDKFEELRGNYPLRREPGFYCVRLINDESGASVVLEKLGFQLLSDSCF